MTYRLVYWCSDRPFSTSQPIYYFVYKHHTTTTNQCQHTSLTQMIDLEPYAAIIYSALAIDLTEYMVDILTNSLTA